MESLAAEKDAKKMMTEAGIADSSEHVHWMIDFEIHVHEVIVQPEIAERYIVNEVFAKSHQPSELDVHEVIAS